MKTEKEPITPLETNIHSLLSRTIKTASSVFVLSGITKIVNLLCNIVIMRTISKESLGTIKIYFEFAFLLMLYFPRETIRKATQKFCADSSSVEEHKKFTIACQFFFMIAFIMHIVGIIIFLLFIYNSGPDVYNNKAQLALYIFSGAIELYGEPIIMYMNLRIEMKQMAVTIGNFGRILTNVFFAVVFNMDLWSFTIARVIGTFCFLAYLFCLNWKYYHLNYSHFIPNVKALLYEKEINGIQIADFRETFMSFIQTTIIKMIMTQFEKIVLGFILNHSIEEKSEYSFIVDNFSFFSRFLLEPIEETFYNLINKTKDKNGKEKGNAICFNILNLFVKGICIFGLLLIGYFFIAGRETIQLVYTEKWATPTTHKIGSVFSIYLAIISINGLIEAYANAINTIGQMSRRNVLFIFNSILQILLLVTLSRIDITGLIYANGICMIIRIISTLYIIIQGDSNETKAYASFRKICLFLINMISLPSVIAISGCVTALFLIKLIIRMKLLLTVASCGLMGCFNVLLIVLLERKRFVEEFNKLKKD